MKKCDVRYYLVGANTGPGNNSQLCITHCAVRLQVAVLLHLTWIRLVAWTSCFLLGHNFDHVKTVFLEVKWVGEDALNSGAASYETICPFLANVTGENLDNYALQVSSSSLVFVCTEKATGEEFFTDPVCLLDMFLALCPADLIAELDGVVAKFRTHRKVLA